MGIDDGQLKALKKHINAGIPDGDLANKPAVPATGVNATNNFGGPMFVYIIGGTLTGVKVDGVTVGATAGMYYVRDGSTIQWVGSAAPTWVWMPAL